jgi:hypothetical protein
MLYDLAQLPKVIVPVDGKFDDVASPCRGKRPESMSISDGFELGVPGLLVLLVVSMLRI